MACAKKEASPFVHLHACDVHLASDASTDVYVLLLLMEKKIGSNVMTVTVLNCVVSVSIIHVTSVSYCENLVGRRYFHQTITKRATTNIFLNDFGTFPFTRWRVLMDEQADMMGIKKRKLCVLGTKQTIINFICEKI